MMIKTNQKTGKLVYSSQRYKKINPETKKIKKSWQHNKRISQNKNKESGDIVKSFIKVSRSMFNVKQRDVNTRKKNRKISTNCLKAI